MAGRFLFHKLASESTGLLSSASARDLAPLTRNASAAKSLPSFSPAAKISKPTTGMPSHRTRTASLDSVRRVKRTFSSSSSDNGVVDWEARKAMFLARLEANKANVSKAFYDSEKAAIIARIDARKLDWEADAKASGEKLEALKERLDKQSAEFNRFLNILLIGFTAVTLMVTYEFRGSPRARRGNKSQASARCSCCGRES